MNSFERKMILEFGPFPQNWDRNEFLDRVSVQPKVYSQLLLSNDYWIKALDSELLKRIYANGRFYFYNLYPVRSLTQCDDKWEFAGRAELTGFSDRDHSLIYSFNLINDHFPYKWYDHIVRQFTKIIVRMHTCILEDGKVTHVSSRISRFGKTVIYSDWEHILDEMKNVDRLFSIKLASIWK